jgi:Fic family protein
MRRETGKYSISGLGSEPVKAFIPHPLPPVPPLEIDSELRALLDDALLALGRLDSATYLLPDISLLLYMYVRKEAVLSSQIEGTQSSISDLLLFELEEAPGVPLDDVQEVSRYVAAMNHGIRRLREGFPLSLRLIREVHAILLESGRGKEKSPGEFRRSQNWIGGSRPGTAHFVPPPPQEIMECLHALELFLHDKPIATSPLIKAGLAHVQFETIHPFLDGNGRVGRLLIALILCATGVLHEPLLYVSLYFKIHREEYYDRLDRVRTEGDWEGWMAFYAKAIRDTATDAVSAAREIKELVTQDKAAAQAKGRLGSQLLAVLSLFAERPIQTIKNISAQTGLVPNTVAKTLEALRVMGIVAEISGKKRNRVYAYAKYMEILNRAGVT